MNEYSSQPKYIPLADMLRSQIRRGDLKPGDRIPSENRLADRYGISRQSVRKALKLLAQEGYLYSRHGSGTYVSERVIHTRTSRNIAVVTTYFSDYIFPRLVQGINQVLTEAGYSILLKTTGNSSGAEARCIEELLSKDIDGMIIEPSKSQLYCRHGSLFEQMEEYDIPCVFLQGYYPQMGDKPYVLVDDVGSGYLITRHLIDQGHRELMGIFKGDDIQGINRHKGYVQALQEAGIAYNPDLVEWFHTEDRKLKPRQVIDECIRGGRLPQAVVCYNDQVADEVIRTLGEHGVRVPEEVSVGGIDNSFLARNGRIPITSVAHPQERLGREAARLLLALIDKKGLGEEERHIVMEPSLVIRESTCMRSGKK